MQEAVRHDTFGCKIWYDTEEEKLELRTVEWEAPIGSLKSSTHERKNIWISATRETIDGCHSLQISPRFLPPHPTFPTLTADGHDREKEEVE